MSENLYLRELSAQISQILFLYLLTVLRHIQTVWPKKLENSHLSEISAQVS